MLLSVLSLSSFTANALWMILSFILPISNQCCLLVTGILLLAGTAVSIAAHFIPVLPRLPNEKGRQKEVSGLWGLLFLLPAAFLLVLDWENLHQGQVPFTGGIDSTAAVVSVLTCLSVMVTSLAGQHCLCWNEDGFVLRTIVGRVHHYGWDAITARDAYRGTERIYVGKRCYCVPSAKLISDPQFWLYAAERRKALGLPPIPWKKHWPFSA